MARKEQFLSKGSIERQLRLTISRLPISTMVPPSAQILQDASSSSPMRELSTTSTPRPLVADITCSANLALRDENMWLAGIPKVFIRKSRFSSVPTVTNNYILESRVSHQTCDCNVWQVEWHKISLPPLSCTEQAGWRRDRLRQSPSE